MSLSDWLKNCWLQQHRPGRQEISDLLGIVERDLKQSQLPELSPDWKLGIAYNAALQAATAALAAEGYRAAREAHHYRTIESLEFTIGADSDVIRQFQAFRKKRNTADYDIAGMASAHEAQEMLELAQELRDRVIAWLRNKHPELI